MDENDFLFWIFGVPIVIILFAVAIREGLFKTRNNKVANGDISLTLSYAESDKMDQKRLDKETRIQELRLNVLPRIEVIQQQLVDRPVDARLEFELGNLYFSIGEFNKAKESYEVVLADGNADQRRSGIANLLMACSLNQIQWTRTYNKQFILVRGLELPTVDTLNGFDYEGLNSVAEHVGNYVIRRASDNPLAHFQAEEAIKKFELVIKSSPTDLKVLRLLREIYSHCGKSGTRQLGRIENLIMKAETPARRPSASHSGVPAVQSTVEKGVSFERRCIRLLEAMDFSVSHTGESGDGGVDIRAVDLTPIKGGGVIVQCKDWKAYVGEPVLRDLYGLVISEGAGKGILIASSRFTSAAIEFANGKPIELIYGNNLHGLELKYLK